MSKKRYIIEIEYDGTDFVGWQEQPKGRTIQETVQDRLSIILREEIKIVGAGRTDTGVHARGMVAHFDLSEGHQDKISDAIYKLNRFLPHDILITSLREASPDFHARFSATSRTYKYYVTLVDSPFRKKFYTYIPQVTDFTAMNKAALYLMGEHDFTTFSKKHTDVHTHLCTVTEAKWTQIEQDVWVFQISANRFLRNMVRSITGTLLEVGQSKLSIEEFANKLKAQDRAQASNTAPATGLFLDSVSYPSELLGETLFSVTK